MANGWALNECGASLICQALHDEGFARYGGFSRISAKNLRLQNRKKKRKSVSMELRSPSGVSRYSSHRGSEGCGESHRGESLPDSHGHPDGRNGWSRGNTHDPLHPRDSRYSRPCSYASSQALGSQSCLEAGCTDYIVKPISFLAPQEKIQALIPGSSPNIL